MDVEKTIQFLLDQQAKSDARQARLDEQLALFAEQSNERMTRLERLVLEIAAAQERTNQIVATLAERHVELAESHRSLAASHGALAEAHKATEEALHALISTVERHLARHN